MAKSLELLLVESVENLGIVGDVVKVRTGYARNFLLPRALATVPSEELVKSLQAKRAAALAEVAALRQHRAETINKLKGFELTIERSCNDAGILYASVTQQEIASALVKAGYGVRPRDVRLSGAIKRVDNYEINIKYETELETAIKLHIKADRILAMDEKPDLDFDREGNLVEGKGDRGDRGEGAEGEGKRGRKGDRGEKAAEPKAEAKAEKPVAAAEDEQKKAVRKPRGDAKPAAKK